MTFPYPIDPFRYPSPMFTIGWGEDLDLNASSGRIASLLNQVPDFRDGTDDLRIPFDIFIKRIWTAEETVGEGGTDGNLLQSTKPFGRGNTKTIYRQQNETQTAHPFVVHTFPGAGFFIKEGTILQATGATSGAGIEQHVMLLDCYSPNYRPQIQLGNPTTPGVPIAHGLKTGTLVAATISGKNDLLGHTADYEDSELPFGIEPERQYTVYGLIPRPGLAAVGVVGFRHQSGMLDWLRPSVFALDASVVFMMEQPWGFNGAEKGAPKLVAAGAVTTSTEFQPLFVSH